MNIRYSAEAVLFFKDDAIVKQMTWSEFHAILDAFVPLADLADQKMQAVYLRINEQLQVVSAVFFMIGFDKSGYADKNWDMPLEQLAENSCDGPDLGAGPIKLSCYSQCSIEWQQKNLWEPRLDNQQNDLRLIQSSINENRLGFVFSQQDEHAQVAQGSTQQGGAALSQQDPATMEKPAYLQGQQQAELLLKEQRLKNKLLAAKAEQDKRQIQLDHQQGLLAYQAELAALQREIGQLSSDKQRLQEECATLKDKNAGMREYYENKLEKLQQPSDDITALKEFYENESKLKIETFVAEQTSLARTKDIEILYRKEREQQLQQEVLTLQRTRAVAAETQQGDDILDRLAESGVSFVVYHPGAGNMVIPKSHIKRYLDNTLAYVAAECQVEEALYAEWLNHFYTPVCQHETESGHLCNKDLLRIEEPGLFISGYTDRCSQHQQSGKVVSIGQNSL